MKKILLTAAIILASVCAVNAQGQKSTQVLKENEKSYQAKQAQDWDNMMKTELKLTDEQSTKIAAINKEFAEKKEAILKDATLSDEARKEKKMALKKEKEEKINVVLTPEQQAKYKQMMYKKTKEPAKKEV